MKELNFCFYAKITYRYHELNEQQQVYTFQKVMVKKDINDFFQMFLQIGCLIFLLFCQRPYFQITHYCSLQSIRTSKSMLRAIQSLISIYIV